MRHLDCAEPALLSRGPLSKTGTDHPFSTRRLRNSNKKRRTREETKASPFLSRPPEFFITRLIPKKGPFIIWLAIAPDSVDIWAPLCALGKLNKPFDSPGDRSIFLRVTPLLRFARQATDVHTSDHRLPLPHSLTCLTVPPLAILFLPFTSTPTLFKNHLFLTPPVIFDYTQPRQLWAALRPTSSSSGKAALCLLVVFQSATATSAVPLPRPSVAACFVLLTHHPSLQTRKSPRCGQQTVAPPVPDPLRSSSHILRMEPGARNRTEDRRDPKGEGGSG